MPTKSRIQHAGKKAVINLGSAVVLPLAKVALESPCLGGNLTLQRQNRCSFACSLYAHFPAKWCYFVQHDAKLHDSRGNRVFSFKSLLPIS